MTKILLKKQMMEIFSRFFRNAKTGKRRTKSEAVLFVLLYLFIFVILGISFFQVSNMICTPLVSSGAGWLYFAIMGLISVALGVLGSVFSTYSSLYCAKDNDLLLSLPVLPSKILSVRLIGVYLMGLMYELIVIVPAIISRFISGGLSILSVIFILLIPFILSFFILSLSCILGWVVAIIASKIKSKNTVTVIVSLVFIFVYYYIYGRAYSALQSILADPTSFGSKIKIFIYPFYKMGLGAEGDLVSILIFVSIVFLIFSVIYAVLSKSFISITTSNKGVTKKAYKAKTTRTSSPDNALLFKELKRFLSSATYMLNSGMGILMIIVSSVLIIIKGGELLKALYPITIGMNGIIEIGAITVICMMVSANCISAPSVSLEGKNIWLVQSLPLSPWQVLKAKLKLHFLMTSIPATILIVSIELIVKPSVPFIFLIPISTVMFIMTSDLFGLLLNLKFPNLSWTSETVPIKQSMSVALSLFGGWAFAGVTITLYIFTSEFISPILYLICLNVVLLILSAIMYRWIKTKGAKIFESL